MGGSSKGTVAPEAVKPISTVNNIGSDITAEGGTYNAEDEAGRRQAVDSTKMGTRGLRIPKLSSSNSTTKPKASAASGITI